MSVAVVDLGPSIAHRIASRAAVSPLGLRFLHDIGSRGDPTLLRLTPGRGSSEFCTLAMPFKLERKSSRPPLAFILSK